MIILNIFDKFIYSITQYMFFSLNLVEILEEWGKRIPIIISLLMNPLFLIKFAISRINLHIANPFVVDIRLGLPLILEGTRTI